MMKTDDRIADLECVRYEAIDFNLDRPAPPPHLIYHFTRQRRKPQMEIRTVDRLGFCAALITEGQAVFEHLGQTVQLRQGSVFLRRHNRPYRFYKTDPDELALTMIMFDPSIESIWNRLIKPDCVAIHPGNSAKVIELTNTCFDLLEQNPEKRIERANAFAPFFLETIAAEVRPADGLHTPERKLAEQCRHYLHEHSARVRSMEQVAVACRLSRGHLYTLFRTHFKTTPKDYLEQLRISAAADLLTQTDWTMERIAEETGYADAPTLSKAFKRRNGVSPAEWRRNACTFAH
ncbi:MAG: helix-turn-helix domain-containing protein [Kiritimatiellales bacterium]